MINTSSMFLVYQDSEGRQFSQHWEDLTNMGTLIDPETGEDMELVGWHSDEVQDAWFAGLDAGREQARAKDHAQQPTAVDVTYPTPRNRAEALALARLGLAYLGVIDSHISAAITRCETDSATQPGPEALTMTADTIRALMAERDAARYRQWRDKMISQEHSFIEAMQDSLPGDVGRIRPPTADEWDAAIDATMQSASHHQEVPRG